MKTLLLIGGAFVVFQYLKNKNATANSPAANASGNFSAGEKGGNYTTNNSTAPRRTTGARIISTSTVNRLKR